jgi:hypothetical protein
MKITTYTWHGVFVAMLITGSLMAAQPSSAQTLPLGLSATHTAEAYGESIGQAFSFVCGSSDGGSAYVYGTDIYTHNSGVCKAAIHSGALSTGVAGVVTIVIGKGAASFRGSERNGVTTSSYGAWSRSFTFVRDAAPGTVTWNTVWNGVPADFTAPIAVRCPAGGAARGKVWGTGPYSGGSAICDAAVHAGVVTAEIGGVAVLQRMPGLIEYPASKRNGVASQRYGAYADAFSVSAATAPVIASPGPYVATSDLAPRQITVSGYTAVGTPSSIADVIFNVPVNLTRLSPDVGKVQVWCAIITGTSRIPKGVAETPVVGGQVITTFSVHVPFYSGLTLQSGANYRYECMILGYSIKEETWFPFDGPNSIFHWRRTSPQLQPISGTITW